MNHYAIVKLLDSTHLVDGSGRRKRYRASNLADTTPGYYAVCWPDDVYEPRFDSAEAIYFGPYKNSLFACLDYLRHREAVADSVREGRTREVATTEEVRLETGYSSGGKSAARRSAILPR